MTGTISFGGIGSNMDTEGVVQGLVKANSGTLTQLTSKAAATDSAVSTLSGISSLLGKLKLASDALADARSVGSYKASSSGTAIVASANGAASPGAYKVNVEKLAKEQRNYSSSFADSTNALHQNGTLSITVGTADQVDIDITDDMSLQAVADKINGSGAKVTASIFNDGTGSRLQIRGKELGAANTVRFGETGVAFGLNLQESRAQDAQDAVVTIDGFKVTRSNNQISGAIAGVTLALSEETTSAITVRVDTDPSGLQTKLQGVVDAYNAVITKIHQTAGYGSVKGSEAALQGDSALRSIGQRMSSAILTRVSGGGAHDTLGAIGLSLDRNGMLSLDGNKLSKALADDPSGVSRVLAGPDNGEGAMDVISKLAKEVTQTKGTLEIRQSSLGSRAQSIHEQATREQDRLNQYAENLRKQFTNMDGTVASNNALLSYLQSLAT